MRSSEVRNAILKEAGALSMVPAVIAIYLNLSWEMIV